MGAVFNTYEEIKGGLFCPWELCMRRNQGRTSLTVTAVDRLICLSLDRSLIESGASQHADNSRPLVIMMIVMTMYVGVGASGSTLVINVVWSVNVVIPSPLPTKYQVWSCRRLQIPGLPSGIAPRLVSASRQQ